MQQQKSYSATILSHLQFIRIVLLLEKSKKIVESPMKSGRTAHRLNLCCCINFAKPLLYGRGSQEVKSTPLVLPNLEEGIYGAIASIRKF